MLHVPIRIHNITQEYNLITIRIYYNLVTLQVLRILGLTLLDPQTV